MRMERPVSDDVVLLTFEPYEANDQNVSRRAPRRHTHLPHGAELKVRFVDWTNGRVARSRQSSGEKHHLGSRHSGQPPRVESDPTGDRVVLLR